MDGGGDTWYDANANGYRSNTTSITEEGEAVEHHTKILPSTMVTCIQLHPASRFRSCNNLVITIKTTAYKSSTYPGQYPSLYTYALPRVVLPVLQFRVLTQVFISWK
jgi:uncharacterized protein involved in tolerance to divalent cations